MGEPWLVAIELIVIGVFLAGIARFRTPRAAGSGNAMVALAIIAAMAVEIALKPVRPAALIAAASLAGVLGGWWSAARTTMTQIPALVAFQNGAGGLAALLVSGVALARISADAAAGAAASAAAGLLVGGITFSGSLLASAKLLGVLSPSPRRLRHHDAIVAGLGASAAGLAIAAACAPRAGILLAAAVASLALGAIASLRIGGADMPVLISFLNALSGLAAALCGIVVANRLLIACGATVAASGSILTVAMCRAMNRRLSAVLRGSDLAAAAPAEEAPREAPKEERRDPLGDAVAILRSARRIVIVPGYGMALARAQGPTVRLAHRLRAMGRDVKFAIHPIAGRMPGHMHVLLAEAEVDPDLLFDLEEANPSFASADAALIVGACDVVNPAAIAVPGTPISGMPILAAHEARSIIVCNLDARPGYSGVENPLYRDPRTILVLGDAAETIEKLLAALG